jgi:DNA replication initiation complex subunit (GINS family)
MTIKDYPSELEKIEKQFYTTALNQIKSLAKKGDFVNAFKFIERAELLDGIKEKIFDEVQKIQIMHGMPKNYTQKNPYKR